MSQQAFWARYRAQRRRLLTMEQQTARTLHALWQMVPHTLQPQVDALLRSYQAEVARIRTETDNPHATVTQDWLQQRLQTLRHAIQRVVDTYATQAARTTTEGARQATYSGAYDAHATLSDQLAPLARYGVLIQAPSPDAIRAMSGMLANGQPLATLFDGFGADAAAQAGDALMRGMMTGSNPSVVARLLDTALGISRSRALTIARTEMLGAYRRAALDGYRANSNVVGGWVWQCADDGRTCAACASMQGSEHTLDETLDGHVNCRCAMLPKTKSYADILGPLGIDASGIPETSISVQSGEDWFAGLSDAQQRNIIGTNAGYAAYKAGDVTLSDFAGVSTHPVWGRAIVQRSLKQMGITPTTSKTSTR